jgi:hypothetical protein
VTNGINEQGGTGEAGIGGGERVAASEEELRQRLEQEIRNLRVEDVVLQSVVSIVNLTARRLGKEDERDLEQARIGIEAVRALVEILPEEPRRQIRNALSELQVLYAREAGAGPEERADAAAGERPAGEPERKEGAREPRPGEPSAGRRGRQGPSKLWTPPGSV